MYSGRKKLIIILIVVFLVLILAIGGVFAYIATDLFKSNQTLFYKYMGQALENVKYVENTQLAEIENLKNQMPYTTKGNLSFEVGETNTDINSDIMPKINLNIESKVNKLEEKSYTKTDLLYNDQNLFTLEYANSNNIYALKSDEIATAFLGIENDNLKVLAQKMGVTDTSVIPNRIELSNESINIGEILAITDEEKAHITETYLSVLAQNINKENFSKDKNITVTKENLTYNATGYRLNLNAEELKQIEIALLQTLKEDSITLNLITTKAKLLGLGEEFTQINNITKLIEQKINEINNAGNIAEAGISIVIYVDNQEVILTEIIFKNEVKYTIYGETTENTRKNYLLIENLSTTAEYSKIEIELNETKSNINSTNSMLVNIDDDSKIEIYIENDGAASENNLKTTSEINISQEESSVIIKYEQEMNFEQEINDIIELNRSNCGVLNDYTTEQLQVLVQSVGQRMVEVLQQKMQLINYTPQIVQDATEAREELIEQQEQEKQSLSEVLDYVDSQL